MSRKGENIYKRKDGRWEGRYIKYRSPEKTCYGYVYGKTYREAKMLLTRAKANEKTEVSSWPEAQNTVTLAQVAAEWMEYKKSLLRESTLVKYRNMLRCYILPRLGDCRIDGIEPGEINRFAFRLQSSGGRKGDALSAKTISDTLSLLQSILKFARENGMPVKYTSCSLPFPQRSAKPLRVFCPEEQQILYKYLAENMTLSNLGILLSLSAGLRIGELCALKWGDISFSEGTLFVQHTMQRLRTDQEGSTKTRIVISDPKSESSKRRIPLLKGILDKLAAVRQPAASFFLTGSPNAFVEPRTMQNRFKVVLKACGIAEANFHALRHTFATQCIEAGFDVKSLSEILGHTNVKITLNRYVHPTLEQKKANMNKLDRLSGISELLTVK